MKHVTLSVLILAICLRVFALIGYGISEASSLDLVNPILSIVSPAGGDTLYCSIFHDVSWNCIETNLSSESASLWYSLDGGISYISMAQNISASESYQWLVPEIETELAKIELIVTDTFGNKKRVISLSPFSIIDAPPSTPLGVIITIDEPFNNVHIFWQPVTTLVTGYLLAADAYIVLCSDTPDAEIEDYTVLSMLKALTYTHEMAADLFDKNFYRIIAVVSDDKVLASIQAKLNQSRGVPITWGELKHDMKGIKE